MADEAKYINFPISLLSGIFEKKTKTLSDILRYSLYVYSKKYKGSETNRMKCAAEYFDVYFTSGDEEKNSNRSLCKAIEDGKRVENSLDEKCPHVSLKLSMFWVIYKESHDEFEIACFCAFCAIKSILGHRDYVKTNKGLIAARMFGKTGKEETPVYPDSFSSYSEASVYLGKRHRVGCCSVGNLQDATKNGKLHVSRPRKNAVVIERNDLDRWFEEHYSMPKSMSLAEKYSLRYHIDRVLFELQANWGLKLYSDHSRGFYLSFKNELVDLAMHNEQAKRTNKYKEYAEVKARAKSEALKRINTYK